MDTAWAREDTPEPAPTLTVSTVRRDDFGIGGTEIICHGFSCHFKISGYKYSRMKTGKLTTG